MIWQEKINLNSLAERSQNTLVTHLGIEFLEIGEDYLTARMPVDARTHQPLGIMHGGASCVLAETVGSTAGQFCVDRSKKYCVGLDINTNHIRVVKSGYVFAKARPFHLGQSTQVWHIEIKDGRERLISVTRLTLAVLNKKVG
jgi:uncharacterized protein (TIGR00369 family)